ncbi:MarC family protein [Sphingomonas quercus]|uniref:UPF0056 membrane protein n=1 Tax=Sphingomonas quercus TaxID=2842451 RepID=A0ABS6BG16_9SPHN|nr:MarC family protein [Sphingomonas quercus]MBU3077236.1 MarC family protein [Sphingomonas quercus]
MSELFLSALVTFFVVIDPPGCAPIFAGLTRGAPAAHRTAMAIRSTLVAAGILFVFAVVGERLLHMLGIGLPAFRIAGGIMLFLIALEMVFEKRTQRREERVREVNEEPGYDPEHDDISVFPMAIPMIAGPGSIASSMLLMARSHGPTESALVLGALALVLLVTMVSLLAAGPLMRAIGVKMEAMITRILGVLLAALAAQFVITGITESFISR